MASSRRRLIAATLLAGLALCGPAFGAINKSALPDDMSLGNPMARLVVVEYASASCPHCAHFNNDVFPAFKAKYIDTGRVKYVFREFLTPPQEVAAASFLLARCAGKDKYFSVLDAVFRGQEQMYQSGDVKGTLLHVAQGAGMNEAEFNACLTNEAAGDALNARVNRYAKEDGINSTPTFVVNGRKMEGAATLANLDAAIAAVH